MALSSKAAVNQAASGKIPFWVRLKAWWEGYDLAIRQKQQIPVDMGELSQDTVRYEEDQRVSKRLEIMQQLWGTGMSGPGDEEYILKLVKPFGLDPAFTVIDVGAGLGGATRLISEKFDIWITGLESDREVANAGMELSTMPAWPSGRLFTTSTWTATNSARTRPTACFRRNRSIWSRTRSAC